MLLPIVVLQLYLNFTVALFAWGPWPWPISNGPLLYAFLGAAHLALLVGYLRGIKRRSRSADKGSAERLLLAGVGLSLLLLLPTSKSRTGAWIPQVLGGLADPAAVYFETNEMVAQAGGNLLEYLRILVGPWLFAVLPLTIFYWNRLSRALKAGALVSIVGFLAIYVAKGTNKPLADTVLLVPCLMAARHHAGSLRIKARRLWLGAAATVVLFGAFLTFFSVSNIARLGGGAGSENMPFLDLKADPGGPLMAALPPEVRLGTLGLTSYLTQGYYGLSLALEQPFVPTYGVGNSFFLYFNAARLLGRSDIVERPYPVRVAQTGSWDAYVHWSSIYPWLASDFSFPGTILVIYFVGRLLAMAWRDTIERAGPYAVCALAQLLIMVFYFPANNQVMQTGESFTAFVGLIGAWLYSRRRRRPRPAVAAELGS